MNDSAEESYVNNKLVDIPYQGETSKMISLRGRLVVVADVSGINVPFYISTGQGGKKEVEVGKWYPILGMGSDGWFNKLGTEEMIKNYYYTDALRNVAEKLDEIFGDIREEAENLNVPYIAGYEGEHLEIINRDMNPIANGEGSSEQILANLAIIIKATQADLFPSVQAEASPTEP